METRAAIKFFFFLQGKAPKEIYAILTETLARFLPDRAKGLSAPLYLCLQIAFPVKKLRLSAAPAVFKRLQSSKIKANLLYIAFS